MERPALKHADCVPCVTSTGARFNLLRLHYGEAPSLEVTFFCRRTVETLLSSATGKTFERVALKTLNELAAEAVGDQDTHPSVLVANAQELALLKAAKAVSAMASSKSSVSLWSAHACAEVLVALASRTDVVDSLRAAAVAPRGPAVSGEDAARLCADALSSVRQFPPTLPVINVAPRWAEGPYALTAAELAEAPLRGELEAFVTHVTATLQLDREAAAPVAGSTVDKNVQSLARILGFNRNVLGSPSAPSLVLLKDGFVLAAFARFMLELRKCKGSGVATVLADVQRVLEYLGGSCSASEGAELVTLRDTLHRLCRQLNALPKEAPSSVEELTMAGQFTDLGTLWAHCDELYEAVDFEARTPAMARKVHDALMVYLCLRENPVVRPTCMLEVKVPGATSACNVAGCNKPGCLGNSWKDGTGGSKVLSFAHFKTAKSHGSHSLVVPSASKTHSLLTAYLDWARDELLAEGAVTDAMWLNTRGVPFASAKSFAAYLPRLLAGCAELTWTRLRHVVAVGLLPMCTVEQVAGLAACMQTSERKLREVYQDNAKEVAKALGLELYRTLAPAPPKVAPLPLAKQQPSGPPPGAARVAPSGKVPLPLVRVPPPARPAAKRLAMILDSDDEAEAAAAVPVEAPRRKLAKLSAAGAAAPATQAPPPSSELDDPDCVAEVAAAESAEEEFYDAAGDEAEERVSPPPSAALAAFLASSPPSAGGATRARGGRPTAQLVAGQRFLTAAEVTAVMESRGGQGVRDVYALLFGKETKSGNLKWVRAALMGTSQLEA